MTDPVNHPPHYKGSNGIETIDVIEAFGLGFHLGNTIKYVLRAGRKNGAQVEDLKKARWYLDREIERLNQPSGMLTALGQITLKPGNVEKGGLNQFPSQVVNRPSPPAPSNKPPDDWNSFKGGVPREYRGDECVRPSRKPSRAPPATRENYLPWWKLW